MAEDVGSLLLCLFGGVCMVEEVTFGVVVEEWWYVEANLQCDW